ncbi:TPA: DNA-formamidopyrimidine glycosylase [Streptococcus suis]
MPELPEVETVRRGLNRLVKGKVISKVEVTYAPMIKTGVDAFCQDLIGQEILDVDRRGKYLLIYLTDHVLISHLRMEGKYNFFADQVPANKHFHAFIDGSTLVYQDVRKFGTMELLGKADVDAYFISRKIGPEPTEEDFDLEEFAKKLAKSKKPIKSHLLDQSLVAGLGNIYVDEVLFKAKVHPAQTSNQLSTDQVADLRQATIEVLQLGIEKGGSTIRTYKNALGMDGTMQDYLQVYGKTGQACPRCQTEIVKIQLGGRGTHFCPKCQVKHG